MEIKTTEPSLEPVKLWKRSTKLQRVLGSTAELHVCSDSFLTTSFILTQVLLKQEVFPDPAVLPSPVSASILHFVQPVFTDRLILPGCLL